MAMKQDPVDSSYKPQPIETSDVVLSDEHIRALEEAYQPHAVRGH